MNVSTQSRVTRAAEGLPRRRFTVAEVEAMVAAGVMKEDERIELVGGELVPMSPKGNQHETLKVALLRRWYRAAPRDYDLAPETTFRLSDDTYLEPDIVVYSRAEGLKGLSGRSVLEYGPASGWLTHWMTQQGADVVVIDIGWDLSTDLIPLATFDLEQTRKEQVARAGQVVNSWWYVRNAFGESARAVYVPVYDLPPDLGRYDVSVFGSILLHLKDPFQALQQAAAVTDDTMVVVEPLLVPPEDIDKSMLIWNPSKSTNPNGWWLLPPGVITDMLDVLGFPDATVSYHKQYYVPETNPELADEILGRAAAKADADGGLQQRNNHEPAHAQLQCPWRAGLPYGEQ